MLGVIECQHTWWQNASRMADLRSLAARYHPQLATLVKKAPVGDEWLHELTYDGYRIGAD
jgi:ATP-dependent DNA ligase